MTAIAKIEKLDVAKAVDLLEGFRVRRSKAISFGNTLIEKAKQGLSSDLDKQLNDYNVALRTTLKDFNDKRSPLTKKMDAIKKQFTSEENALKDQARIVQQYRDDYAKQVAQEREAKEIEANRERLSKTELIELTATIERGITEHVQASIDAMKKGILSGIDSINDKNIDEKKDKLSKLVTDLNPEIYNKYSSNITSKFGHDVVALTNDIMESKSEALMRHYKTEISQFKQEAILVVNDIVKSEDRAAVMKAREEKIAIDSANAAEVANVVIDTNKEAAQASAAFESVVISDEAPEARKGYKILVKERSDYSKVVASWFAFCASECPINSFDKKTLGSMVKDLEKLAYSTGRKVDGLIYNEVFKAINRG